MFFRIPRHKSAAAFLISFILLICVLSTTKAATADTFNGNNSIPHPEVNALSPETLIIPVNALPEQKFTEAESRESSSFEIKLEWWITALATSLLIFFIILFLLIITLRNLNLNRKKYNQNEATVHQLLKSLRIAICITKFNGTILTLNEPFSRLINQKQNLINEANIFRLLPKTKKGNFKELLKAVKSVRDSGIPYIAAGKEYHRSDGFSAWLEISLSRIEWRGSSELMIRVIDLSHQKETEDKLRQVEKMQAIGQLAGGIAHDFNNQIMAIQGYANLLSENLKGEDLEYVMHIKRSAESSQELTKQLLAFSRKGTFSESFVDIGSEIDNVIALLSRSIDRKIVLKKSLPNFPVTALGDISLLQNALLNLGLNARDAMPMGGMLIYSAFVQEIAENEIHWINGILPEGKYCVITVSDTGSGIPRHILPKVFDPFFTTKPSGSGTGMGLAAVLGTMTRHNGAIVISTELHKGTTFTLYLPYLEHVPQSHLPRMKVAQMSTPLSKEKLPVSNYNILVCDDEQVIRFLLKNILTKAGHAVTTCSDGLEVLNIFQNDPDAYNLVILDMIMPIMSGEDIFYKIREIRKNVPILIISGFSEIEHSSALLKKGLNAYLAKPISPIDLHSVVDRLLAKKY
ncbi:MAG: response regulator [Bacteroidetes bacterium]|nr:response regulator [Bacteroidota bacterium]